VDASLLDHRGGDGVARAAGDRGESAPSGRSQKKLALFARQRAARLLRPAVHLSLPGVHHVRH
jgi:hypothetical protein